MYIRIYIIHGVALKASILEAETTVNIHKCQLRNIFIYNQFR